MRETTEITAIGPYVRVTLPDVLPPNWEELRRDLEPELDEGASLVTFVLGPCCGVDRDDPSLLDFLKTLRSVGVVAGVVN